MNIFQNNYTKLLDENEQAESKLSFKNSSDIRDAINYFRGQGTSLFELEVIKKDMISLAQEAEIENLSLEEKLGMSIQEFCESMKRENPTSNWLGHLLKLLQTAFFIYTPLYTLEFFMMALSSPKHFGISIDDVIFISLLMILDYGIDYLLNRLLFEPSSKKRKFLINIRRFIWILYFTVFFLSVSYFDFASHYLIRGNGWVIEATLLLITFLLWIGNNYYWNKQSEKYNWK